MGHIHKYPRTKFFTTHFLIIGFIFILVACSNNINESNASSPTSNISAPPSEALSLTSNIVPPIEITETRTPSPTVMSNRIISEETVGNITQLYDPFPVQFRITTEIAFVNNVPYLIEVLHEEAIEIHNIRTGTILARIEKENAQIEKIVASQDGHFLATISPGQRKVSFWDLETLEYLFELDLEGFQRYRSSSPIDGTFSSDNRYFAVWGCQTPDYPWCASSRIVVYDLIGQEVVSLVNGLQRFTHHAEFNNENKYLIIVGEGEHLARNDLLIWDIQTDKEADSYTCLECEDKYSSGFFDGAYINNYSEFVANTSGKLIIFNVKSWEVSDVWEFPNCSTPHHLDYIESTDVLVGFGCNNILFVSAVDGKILREIDVGIGYIDDIYMDNIFREVYIVSDVGYIENNQGEIEYLLGGNGFVSQWGLP